MEDYSEAPSELMESVIRSAGSLVVDCELCDRTHFATMEPNVFDEGELKDLREKAKKEPDKYIEDSSYDTVSWGKINGKQAVIGCPCNGLKPIEDFIWRSRYVILEYLERRSKERFEDAKRDFETVEKTKKAVK